MAFPKELTIATGLVAYEADPDSDERIRSHEVRVSVTYELERDDMDVLRLAALKAAEVEEAHATAWRQVRPRRAAGSVRCPAAPSSPEPHTKTDGDDEDGGIPPPAPTPLPANGATHEATQANGTAHPMTPTVPAAPRQSPPPAAVQELASSPLKLSIKSAAKRAGLDADDLTILIAQHFGRPSLDKLTRDEATTLHQSLQRDGTGNGLQRHGNPAYAGAVPN